MKTYTVIVKILCPDCKYNKDNSLPIVKNCTKCDFVKYHNVTRLVSMAEWLDKNKPNWIWMKVYGKSERKGELLHTYISSYKLYQDQPDGSKKYIGMASDRPTQQQI